MGREGEVRILTASASRFRLGSGKADAFPIHETIRPGEILLLLSDGAWTPISPYSLAKATMSAAARHFSDVPESILEAAGRTGRAEDVTAVALRATW